MTDLTTEENNLRGRVEWLEKLLDRIDAYLDNNKGIVKDSQCHREIKLTLGKAKWGERVVYADEDKNQKTHTP